MSRPRSVTLLAWWVLLLGFYQALGALGAMQNYAFLSELPLSVPLPYLVGSRAAWAVVFVVLAFGVWRLRSWGRQGLLVAFPLFLAQAWLDRLAFGQGDFLRQTVLVTAGLHAASLILVGWVLLRRRGRESFSA